VRLATWNCRSGFRRGWGVVPSLGANVLSIQEFGPETKAEVESIEGWSCEWQRGRYDDKGVVVLAHDPYEIDEIEFSFPCAISARIGRPDAPAFRFVGFWGMTPMDVLTDDYPMQAREVVRLACADDVPTVIAGDFNAKWLNRVHQDNVATLTGCGLVEAYHEFHGVASDDWHDATLYWKWSRHLRYHMDYVFLPSSWTVRDVEVGSYETYVEPRISDHVPVVVTVDDP
jgi:Endonuclease/Exonuclease/phosphatase family